jgi:nucleoside-diphosphate-sugar epimerase
MSSETFLVAGGSGFLGRALIKRLVQLPGCSVVAPLRPLSADLGAGVRSLPLTSLNAANDWSTALIDVDMVVHVAARVHGMKDKAADPLTR